MTEEDRSARRPWYSFPVRWLGAHLSMWVLLAALVALYFSAFDFVVWLSNRGPTPVEVSTILEKDQGLVRWVETNGVLLRLAPAILPEDRRLPDNFELYDTVLLDRSSPAATRWREIFAHFAAYDRARAENSEARWEHIRWLISEMNRLEEEPSRLLPSRALLLFPGPDRPGPPAREIPPPPDGAYPDPEKLFLHHRARLEANVLPDTRLIGLLEPIQASIQNAYEPLGLELPHHGLITSATPSPFPALVFGLSSLAALSLLLAFWGLYQDADEKETAEEETPLGHS